MSKGSKRTPAKQHQPGQVVSASFSGPLPPPSILQGYDELHPGAAETIIKTYEAEVHHRQDIERKMIAIEGDAQKAAAGSVLLGQLLGAVICVLLILCGTYLVSKGHNIAGTIFGGSSLAAIVAAFLLSRTSHK